MLETIFCAGLVSMTRCPKKPQMGLVKPARQSPLVELGNSLSCRSRQSLHTPSPDAVGRAWELREPALFNLIEGTD
jgi:hypothetical protein